MKKLNTLVDDIYKKLSALGEGKSLNLSDEVIDQFGEDMKEVLRHWSNPRPRDKESLRMSNIGRPNRQLWFDMKTEAQAQPMPPAPSLSFFTDTCLKKLYFY